MSYLDQLNKWVRQTLTDPRDDVTPQLAASRLEAYNMYKTLEARYYELCHMGPPQDVIDKYDDLLEQLEDIQVDIKLMADRINEHLDECEAAIYENV